MLQVNSLMPDTPALAGCSQWMDQITPKAIAGLDISKISNALPIAD
jgi:hypothetical protein